MKKSRFTVEQITYALKQVEMGNVAVGDMCRKLGVSQPSLVAGQPQPQPSTPGQ